MTGEAQIVYLHGMPGGPDELTLFGAGKEARTRGFHVPDRMAARIAPDEPYFVRLAAGIVRNLPDRPLHLVGFSLGATAALRLAPHLGDRVQRIDLVSAAAPLSLGDYLDGMAGRQVFGLALDRPRLFAVFVRLQAAMARFAGDRLFAMLFADAKGEDRRLAADPQFRAAMRRLLQAGPGSHPGAFRREVALYVEDWSHELARVPAPVTLHHGELDDWTPPAMAHDLAARLPRCEGVRVAPGLSHYSMLERYLAG